MARRAVAMLHLAALAVACDDGREGGEGTGAPASRADGDLLAFTAPTVDGEASGPTRSARRSSSSTDTGETSVTGYGELDEEQLRERVEALLAS